MSKVAKTISKVTGVIASIAAFVPGLQPIAAVAGAVSAVSGTFAQLTAPKPAARGSVTNVIIDAEPPRPYMIGESYSAGILRHRAGYGPTTKDVPNPNLMEVKTFSGVGPVEALAQELFNFTAIGSYYSGFYSSDTQLGARPEATALVPPYDPPATRWNSASKLSGYAAILSNYKFDRDGEVFASGLPQHGAIWRGEKSYDPRLDSTYPGGSGSCRLGDESTYVYSGGNPAIEAAMYLYGRYENGIKVFGVGVSEEGIDWAAVVDWANLCDLNGWTCDGTIYEGGVGSNAQQQKTRNLDDICASGGGWWMQAGGKISFDWHRPRVSLATLTDDDILEEGTDTVAVQSVRERMNGVRPQYISPAHNWEQITADEIIGSTYRAEDGTPLTQTWALNLVKTPEQAGELASYALVDSREVGPITVKAKASWRFYKPGETITVDSAIVGYNGQAVIASRSFDPVTMAVTLVLKSETPAKHDFALGKVATPPPTPLIELTQEQRDEIAREIILNERAIVLADVPAVVFEDSTVTRQMVLTRGSEDVTADATWQIASVAPGVTASIDVNGLLSVTGATSSGSVVVRAVLDIATYDRAVSVIFGLQGADGNSTATVSLYQYAASAPALPSTDVVYTFSDGTTTAANNGWVRFNNLGASNGNPLYETQGQAIGNGATAVIAPADWSAAQEFNQEGFSRFTIRLYRRNAVLPPVPDSPITFTVDPESLTGITNSWQTKPQPSDGNPEYYTETTFLIPASATTRVIQSSDWSTPIIHVQDGAPGAPGGQGDPGTEPPSAQWSNENVSLFAYANGNVASYAPATGTLKVTQGTTDITSNFTLETLSNPQGLTMSYAGDTYSVTGGFDPAEDTADVLMRAVGSGDYAGVTFERLLSLSKSIVGYEIVATLPSTDLFAGRVVFLTTDEKLYRYNGTAWTAAVPAADISGEITGVQIADDAITTPKLAAGAVVSQSLASGSVTTDALASGSVTAAKANITTLSSLTADVGLLRTATTGARMEIRGTSIRIYYANGVVAVEIGF